MATIDNIPSTEGVLDSLSKINGNFTNLNADKIEAASVDTLTNKTINADNNTISELEVDNIKTASKTGIDTKIVTGTNGTTDRLTKWDANGDLVESSLSETDVSSTVANATLNTDTDVSGNDWVLDEDDMASDSATKVPTQQSVKAYVDENGAASPDSFTVGLIPPSTLNAVTYSDEYFRTNAVTSANSVSMVTENSGGITNNINGNASTWTDADTFRSQVIADGFYYAMMEDTATSPDTFRVYRYPISSITDAGTLMTFSGATVLAQSDEQLQMAFDGTHFYFTHEAGNSANSYVIAKYSLSGTVLTYVSSITLSDATSFNGGFAVDSTGRIYTSDSTANFKQYSSTGTLELTSGEDSPFVAIINFKGEMYLGNTANDTYQKMFL